MNCHPSIEGTPFLKNDSLKPVISIQIEGNQSTKPECHLEQMIRAHCHSGHGVADPVDNWHGKLTSRLQQSKFVFSASQRRKDSSQTT